MMFYLVPICIYFIINGRMDPLKILLNIFILFGLCTWTPSFNIKHLNRENILLGWKVIHIIVTLTIALITMYYHKSVFYVDSSFVDELTDAIQFVLPCLAHIIILFEMLYYYKIQRDVWKIPIKVYIKFTKIGIDAKSRITEALWKYLCTVIAIQAFSLTTEIRVVYGAMVLLKQYKWGIACSLKLLPYSMGRMSILFHLFFLEYIKHLAKILIEELHYLGTVSKRKHVIVDEKLLTSKLLFLKDIYTDLAIMNGYLNKMFRLSHMFNILGMFITLSACFYWGIFALQNGTSHPIETILCPLATMLILIYFTLSSEDCLKTLRKIPSELHRFETCHQKKVLGNIVQTFMLQLELQPIRISDSLFFEINANLLTDITAATCTYMIIFLQSG